MGLAKSFVRLAKKLPIDLAQAELNETTKGKLIALDLVPRLAEAERGSQTALDVGCRAGNQTRWLESIGYTVTSIDVEKTFDKCIIVDADKRLPFDDNSFDLVWCSEVMEHLRDPEFSANEIRRILKDGGMMILTTPNTYFWLMRPLHLIGLTPDKLQNDDHKQFFSMRDICRLFPNAEIFGYFPYMLIKRKIRCCLGPLTPTFVICERRPEAGAVA
jgi:SAM-dependent methyltransferase